MRPELTHEGSLVKLANHYTTRGTHAIYKVSSSSYRAASTAIPDLLSPPVSIVHRSREVFQAISCIGTKLLYCSTIWVARQADGFFICFGAKPDKGFLNLKSRRIRKW